MIHEKFRTDRLAELIKCEKEVIERHVRKDMKVLDLGCGDGRLITEILKKTKFVTGIDINPLHIKAAIKSFPDVKFILGDLNNDLVGSYDLLIALGDTLALAHGKHIEEYLKMLFEITEVIIFSFPPKEYLIREAERRGESYKKVYVNASKFYPDWNNILGEGEMKTMDLEEFDAYEILEKKDIYFSGELSRHIFVLRRKSG